MEGSAKEAVSGEPEITVAFRQAFIGSYFTFSSTTRSKEWYGAGLHEILSVWPSLLTQAVAASSSHLSLSRSRGSLILSGSRTLDAAPFFCPLAPLLGPAASLRLLPRFCTTSLIGADEEALSKEDSSFLACQIIAYDSDCGYLSMESSIGLFLLNCWRHEAGPIVPACTLDQSFVHYIQK